MQADLLSVGMRVRKAVPEGYKTVANSCSDSAFSTRGQSLLGRPAAPQDQRRQQLQHATHGPAAGKTRPSGEAAARELLPFCGILKVGGLGVQEHAHAPHGDGDCGVDDDIDAPFPGAHLVPDLVPSSSDGSNASPESSCNVAGPLHPCVPGRRGLLPGRKRAFEEDDVDEFGDDPANAGSGMLEVGRWADSYGNMGPAIANEDNAWAKEPWGSALDARNVVIKQRPKGGAPPLARPRRRLHGPQRLSEPGPRQHPCRGGGVDFDEAPFLDAALLQAKGDVMETE